MPEQGDPQDRPLKRPEDYYIKVLLSKVPLKDIMTAEVIAAQLDTPFSQVAKMLLDSRIRHVPVVTSGNKLVGLISQRDLFRTQAPVHRQDGTWYYDKEALDMIILSRVMTPDPFALQPDSPVGEALVNMVNHRYGCIPIVDKDHVLCGIVTQLDVLKLAARIYAE